MKYKTTWSDSLRKQVEGTIKMCGENHSYVQNCNLFDDKIFDSFFEIEKLTNECGLGRTILMEAWVLWWRKLKMKIEDVKRNREKKVVLSIRIDEKMHSFLKKKDISPAILFRKAVQEMMEKE